MIEAGVADTDGVYSNGKMVRMSEEGILAFGKSDAMKRRSPMGVKVQTSSRRSRFVCERTAVTVDGLAGGAGGDRFDLTFDDDDLAVDDCDCERAGFHHLTAEVLQEMLQKRIVDGENTFGRDKTPSGAHL